jgi:transcriptional regulator with XRE-family HTH domain
MTNLSDYLKRNEIRDEDFAAKIGKDRTTINRWKKGRGSPSLIDAAKIEAETNGEVPMRVWVFSSESASA